ncbi:MAG: polysaccharide deacetylase family protein [Bacteroidota bacterium]|nr:polysaccharide deacetylase family protein [Bacteroidota bacterium]
MHNKYKKGWLIRTLVVLITLHCSLNANSGSIGATKVCELKDNKKAAYTFTTDDGVVSAIQSYNVDFKRLNLRGSMALVAGWISDKSPSNWNFWNKIIADGHFDVTNHSMTHIYFDKLGSSATGLDSLNNEINGAQVLLKSKLSGQDMITMANPYIINSGSADELIKQHHFAARNGTIGYNTLNPTDEDWYRLNFQNTFNRSKLRATYPTELNNCLDYAIKNRKWLIILAHGIGKNRGEMVQDSITSHFEYVASKLDSVWCGTFNELTKYIREKQHISIAIKKNSSTRLVLSVTHNLDTKIFNFPLTLKTQVSPNWKTVRVIQNNISQTLTPKVENGNRYLYYDVQPNGGNITLVKYQISSSCRY